MMVVMPPPTAATIPAFDTVATDLLVLVHVTVFVLASDGATVAVSCLELPFIRERLVDDSVTPVTGTRTVTLHSALWPPLDVAVIVAVPAAFAVTRPEVDTDAIAAFDDDHVTLLSLAVDGATVAVSCCVLPLIIVAVVGETVIPDVGVVTTTVHDAVFAPSAVVAVIVAVPLAFAVTRPDEFTVATLVLLLLQE